MRLPSTLVCSPRSVRADLVTAGMARRWVFMTLLLTAAVAAAQPSPEPPFIVVLGTAQDAGYPQAGCRRACCQLAWQSPPQRRFVACIAIIDPRHKQRWLVDCTPDFREQLRALDQLQTSARIPGLDGVLLTHAHVGHYAGLIHLGREVIGAKRVPVYAMPRMRFFLESNGPWDQLVKLRQIEIRRLVAAQPQQLNERITVTPFLVPHRDEYSETVGFRIQGPTRTVVFLPDIDKWERWSRRIEEVIKDADVAYLDGTFYSDGELRGRKMSEVPHPFVKESLARFQKLPRHERQKVRFIHMNHTNPVLNRKSPAAKAVRDAGHHVARQGERISI